MLRLFFSNTVFLSLLSLFLIVIFQPFFDWYSSWVLNTFTEKTWLESTLTSFFNIVNALLILFPIYIILIGLYKYPIAKRSLKGIVNLYISVILVFSSIYFFMNTNEFSPTSDRPFKGMTIIYSKVKNPPFSTVDNSKLLPAAIDSFHYSVVTMTTVGYGDMYPTKWYSKLVVDIQLLIGVLLIVISINSYFSERKIN